MKVTLHVSYNTQKWLEGFRFTDYKNEFEGHIYMGEIEIDNPFDVPDQSMLNDAKLAHINEEIKSNKAQINLLENQVKDLLSIEHKEAMCDE